jgi:lysophospholipase L1-like esterase
MREESTMRLGRWKTIAYSLLPLLVLCALLEGLGRVVEWYRPPIPVDVSLSFSPESRLFVPGGGIPGWLETSPAKSIPHPPEPHLPLWVQRRKNAVPFRWQTFLEKRPENVFRVFVVGESSVNYAQGNFQHALESLEPLLGGRSMEVINAGGCAYGSQRLLLVVLEILNYQPDAVLLYLGHNESEEGAERKALGAVSVTVQRVLWQSAALRVVRDVLATREIERLYGERAEARQDAQVKPRPLENRRLSRAEMGAQVDTFRRNVEAMIAACKEKGVRVVLGTIPSNLWKPDLAAPEQERYMREVHALFDAGDYAAGEALAQEILCWAPRHQSSNLENAALRDMAAKWSVPLADVEARVKATEPHGIPGETLFTDHCHLNNRGSDLLAEAYAEALKPLLEAPAPTP